MPTIFELKSAPNLPLDVSAVSPGNICGLDRQQVANLKIGVGNRHETVSDWFDIAVDSGSDEIVFKGELSNVHGIGQSIDRGRIEVFGNAGRHVAASASGGEIIVRGNVEDYAGYEMRGGTLVVHGNAGDHVGACYPGDKFGMNRGTILIQGNAGKGLGYRMRRGTIVVGGDTGDAVGWQMRAGTIFVLGCCHGRPGIDMKRGTIIARKLNGASATFARGPRSEVRIIQMLQDSIAGQATKYGIKFKLFEENMFESWHGDLLLGGRGELFVSSPEA